jgi:hypothetical protein
MGNDKKVISSDITTTIAGGLPQNAESVKVWKAEIEQIVSGERDNYIERWKGSIKIYVESELFPPLEKENREKYARVSRAFLTALNETISEWNLSLLREKEYFACLLEMIRAYTPDTGFEKAIGFLQIWGKRLDEIPVFGGYNSNTDLIQSALFALDAHFSVPPQNARKNKSYQIYLQLLRDYMFVPEYSGYAAVKLLTLKEQDLSDTIYYDAIKNSHLVLDALCFDLFYERKKDFVADLTQIAEFVFAANEHAVLFFEEMLKLNDCDVSYDGDFPVIMLGDGTEIKLDVLGEPGAISMRNVELVRQIQEVQKAWDYSGRDEILEIAEEAYEREKKYFVV